MSNDGNKMLFDATPGQEKITIEDQSQDHITLDAAGKRIELFSPVHNTRYEFGNLTDLPGHGVHLVCDAAVKTECEKKIDKIKCGKEIVVFAGNYSTDVQAGDYSTIVVGNYLTHVTGDYHAKVTDDYLLEVDGDYTSKVNGRKLDTTIGSKLVTIIGGKTDVTLGGKFESVVGVKVEAHAAMKISLTKMIDFTETQLAEWLCNKFKVSCKMKADIEAPKINVNGMTVYNYGNLTIKL